MNDLYLWLVNDDPYKFRVADDAEAYRIAIGQRLKWAGYKSTFANIREVVRWFRKNDQLIDVTNAEEL